ncbi:MDR family oxidoreductase [Aureimonas populi]|uniref:MDR family oxidoreductase n=1 Tax=Aureimonas populi TaxID=1701758 RepID=A0ABW5CRY6_9HYPH|nr:MDR family oxidoreductase [Aureimonas populi]
MAETFRAILVTKGQDGGQRAAETHLTEADLMEGEVDVAIEATTVNYKDGLAMTGKSPIVRRFPLIPGIDFAGTVTASSDPRWKAGDAVLANGWGLGETHHGGYAERARVKGDWLVRRPPAFSAMQAAAIGTAGYTAMLCLMKLEKAGVTPGDGPVIVTGAAGGVGSVALAILKANGWHVVASTGRPQEAGYLKDLGADEIVDRAEFSGEGKPLGKERFAAGIDSVGSHTLANVLSQVKAEGAVAACGLAQGMDLPTSVAPFILRGISLLGVNSVYQPQDTREEAWSRLARDLDPAMLASITREIGFEDIISAGADIVEGKVRGRLVARLTP